MGEPPYAADESKSVCFPSLLSRSQSLANCRVLSRFLGSLARFCCAGFFEVINEFLRTAKARAAYRSRELLYAA
jgi:hypothetical protein